MSFGRLSGWPLKLLASTVTVPSGSSRVIRRVNASHATSRPCVSRVIPLAQLVFSLKTEICWPGEYFHPFWSVPRNKREPPSFHHTGPSPCAFSPHSVPTSTIYLPH